MFEYVPLIEELIREHYVIVKLIIVAVVADATTGDEFRRLFFLLYFERLGFIEFLL